MQSIICLYGTFSEALHTIQELEAVKIRVDDISLIVKNGKSTALEEMAVVAEKLKARKKEAQQKQKPKFLRPVRDKLEERDLKAEFFSTVRLHWLAGIGPVCGAGWFLKDAIDRTPEDDRELETAQPIGLGDCLGISGMDEEHVEAYIEGLKRGATLVAAYVTGSDQSVADRIMRREHQPLDPHMRGNHYWTGPVEPKDPRVAEANRLLSILISNSGKNDMK